MSRRDRGVRKLPLSKIESDSCFHLKYDGSDVGAAGELREELLREAASITGGASGRATIVEFPDGAMIYSSEIGILVQFIKAVSMSAGGKTHVLHIAANDDVLNILQSMNLHKLPGLELHKNVSEIAV